jgi:hypothetical protein
MLQDFPMSYAHGFLDPGGQATQCPRGARQVAGGEPAAPGAGRVVRRVRRRRAAHAAGDQLRAAAAMGDTAIAAGNNSKATA